MVALDISCEHYESVSREGTLAWQNTTGEACATYHLCGMASGILSGGSPDLLPVLKSRW
jgi:hypothetical protein